MIALDEHSRHKQVSLLLPWMANGRLAGEDRQIAEEHVRRCGVCERELELQLRMCDAFTQPDRVIYAPGPSFRKLMERIDGDAGKSRVRSAPRSRPPSLISRLSHVSLWRPPGIAWAASFLILFGITGVMFTAYRWTAPDITTRTDRIVPGPDVTHVLHIALDRTLPIGEVEDLLRSGGARIVEGPDDMGVLGVKPLGIVDGQTATANAHKQLRALSARLRADPRILWIEPLPNEGTPAQEAPGAAEQRAPDAREH